MSRKIFGVGGGLAECFGTDSSVMRIIRLLLTFLTGNNAARMTVLHWQHQCSTVLYTE